MSKLSTLSKLLPLCLSLSFLSGCTTLFNSGFECSKVGGQNGCVSLNDINQQASQIVADSNQKSTTAKSKANNSTPQFMGSQHSIPEIGLPVRVGESIQKVLLFDYIDKAGNYHEPSVIYTILKASQWQKHAVHEIQTMEAI